MTLRNLLRTVSVLALIAAAPATRAGGFSTTNVQLLDGFNWDDDFVGHPKDGQRSTLTLNTFSTWEYGDSFFFADLNQNFTTPGDKGTLYAEWHPRLFLDQVLGQKEPLLGVIRHWGLAGEVNQGSGFGAYLGGVGFDFAAPAGWVLGLNVYYRYDLSAYHQYQISPYWTVPFSIGPVPFLFTGFVDVNGTKDGAGKQVVEVWAQPELLVDVLAPFGGPKGKLHVGTEVWYHRGIGFNPDFSLQTEITETVVPQAMVQWTVF
jgi:nucleoside-specific outer membrane channel protein Tsx